MQASELFSFEPFALAVLRGDAEFQLVADRVLSQLNRSDEIVGIYENGSGALARSRQPQHAPDHRFSYHASVVGEFQASPLSRRLAVTYCRIEFVILRTNLSSPVAPHPASRRRSYL